MIDISGIGYVMESEANRPDSDERKRRITEVMGMYHDMIKDADELSNAASEIKEVKIQDETNIVVKDHAEQPLLVDSEES